MLLVTDLLLVGVEVTLLLALAVGVVVEDVDTLPVGVSVEV